MTPIHPGRILRRELAARNLSANRFALAIRVPSGRVTEILNGKRGVTPETALRFERYFGHRAEFWMTLQTRYELAVAKHELSSTIESEVQKASNS
jgi:antitoxin HigA-1